MIFAFYLVLFLLFFVGIKGKSKLERAPIFSRGDTLAIKGFSAMLVLFHHLGQSTGGFKDPLNINNFAGANAVGIFFMLSAYGLFKASARDNRYYKKILLSKLPFLYFYQVLFNALYYGLFFKSESLSARETFARIFNLDLIFRYNRLNEFSWFMTTIMFVYLLFAVLLLVSSLLDKKIKRKRLFLAIGATIISVAELLIVQLSYIDNLYYRGILCFAVGAWLSLFENEICNFLEKKRNRIVCTLVLLAVAIPTHILSEEILASVSFTLLFGILFTRISISGNKIFAFLGAISLEIYLVQYIFFLYSPSSVPLLKIILITGATILSAFLINGGYTIIKKSYNYVKSILFYKKNN